MHPVFPKTLRNQRILYLVTENPFMSSVYPEDFLRVQIPFPKTVIRNFRNKPVQFIQVHQLLLETLYFYLLIDTFKRNRYPVIAVIEDYIEPIAHFSQVFFKMNRAVFQE